MNFKHFNTWSIAILLVGLIFLTHSIVTLIYSEPVKVVFRNNSLWPFQKSMADFSITFVLGIGFFSIGIYRLIYKNKIISKHTKWEKELKEKEKKKRRFDLR